MTGFANTVGLLEHGSTPLTRPLATAAGWLFERLYHELAWAYDAVSWLVSGGRWPRWQRAALPHLVGRRVLDVGCGPGHFLAELIHGGYAAYGLERSPQMRGRANGLLVRRDQPWRVVGGDAWAMPFADATFDSLVLTFPAPFVRESAFWREAARVLRPEGRVVVVEGALSNTRLWPGILEWAWGRLVGGPHPPPLFSRAGSPRRRLTERSGCWWSSVRRTVS